MNPGSRFMTATALVLALGIGAATPLVSAKRKRQTARFTVRIENISNKDGMTASDGTKWPFAISPGAYAVHKGNHNPLFSVGKFAGSGGLEAQAEDGSPDVLEKSASTNPDAKLSGTFKTPIGTVTPGAAGPGAAYEFSFTAEPGAELCLTTMFGQSNDLFYGDEKPISLFDSAGKPINGDITSQIALFDAGTEVNQEPGIGPDQAPRQKAPNTGASEHKPIGPVIDKFSYPATASVLRVTITSEM
jgi:hypothetical protein